MDWSFSSRSNSDCGAGKGELIRGSYEIWCAPGICSWASTHSALHKGPTTNAQAYVGLFVDDMKSIKQLDPQMIGTPSKQSSKPYRNWSCVGHRV